MLVPRDPQQLWLAGLRGLQHRAGEVLGAGTMKPPEQRGALGQNPVQDSAVCTPPVHKPLAWLENLCLKEGMEAPGWKRAASPRTPSSFNQLCPCPCACPGSGLGHCSKRNQVGWGEGRNLPGRADENWVHLPCPGWRSKAESGGISQWLKASALTPFTPCCMASSAIRQPLTVPPATARPSQPTHKLTPKLRGNI